MQTQSNLPAFSNDISSAVLSSYANIAEDGTICFVSDKIYRACDVCGTVFVGSAYRAAFAGPPTCPFCGALACAPVVRGRLS
ncbi:MAG: hypothetical protein ACP59X_00175 [Solidesulfovibrio sp. DCME]|uniref:hypothetical protein n=1 Tax=Solidesulfovibrio sp. DCME TaxID=3447380 RepID=UPI003D146E92